MAETQKRNIYISINGKEVVNSLNGIGKAISQTNRDVKNLNKNDADYQEQLRNHKETLAQLRAEYGRTKDEINGVPSVLNKVKSSLGGVATGMIKAFSIGAVASTFITKVSDAKDIVVQFDQAQADLAGILQTNKAGIISLTADSLKYGATTSFTATQVSSLQLELAKLGKTKSEIKAMTKGVLDAAVAMDAELGEAAAFVGGQLNSFNESASAAGKYADILSNSTNISATSFEYLSTAIPKTSKVAAEANVTFEKMNATIGVLADQNIAAETAGTGFRNILLTSAKEGRHYEELLKDVANATDKTQKATELFGKENATVAVVLATSTQKIIDQTEALEHSAGSAAALAETKLDSIKGSATLFQSAWEGMILSVENGTGFFAKATRGFIDFGTEIIGLINPMRALSDELKDEQLQLNILVERISSSNISQEERKKLLLELKANYPDFIAKIDDETMSNEALQKTLKDINGEYRERLRLQAMIEKAERSYKDFEDTAKHKAKLEFETYERLQKAKMQLGSATKIDMDNLGESAKLIKKELIEAGKYTGYFSNMNQIEHNIKIIDKLGDKADSFNEKYQDQLNMANEYKDTTVKITEEERIRYKMQQQHLDELIKKAKELGGIDGKDFFSMNAESVERYLKTKEVAPQKGNSKTKKEIAQEEKLAARKKALFEKGEKEIDQILLASLQNRESRYLTGFAKEVKNIESKFALEIQKYKEHTGRIKELEAARDAEISELKKEKANEYALQIFDIEKAIEEEKEIFRLEQMAENADSEEQRQLLLLDKARFIANLELDIELEKELAKVEAVENAEELKEAIRDKYAQKKFQNDTNFDAAEKALRTNQVDWTRITEKQKLDVIIGSLNAASNAFNEGSGAWKAIKVAETIITTYQSATNAYNSLAGIPVVGPGLGATAAGLAILTGLKNVQKITSTDMQKMPSFYYGGHTGSASGSLGGDKYGSFTGMTHANEWVMPAFMTQSPRYAQTLSWLENERKYGVSSNSAVAPASNTDNTVLIALSGSVERLSAILENGITADTRIGYEEIIKMNKLNDDIRQSQNQ